MLLFVLYTWENRGSKRSGDLLQVSDLGPESERSAPSCALFVTCTSCDGPRPGHTGHCIQALADLLLATVISFYYQKKKKNATLRKTSEMNQRSALRAELARRENRTWNTLGGAGMLLEERVQVLETSTSEVTPADR